MTIQVNVQTSDAIAKLGKIEKNISIGVDVGLVEAAKYVQGEVKQSVAGRASETRSVDTGRFLNSVSFGQAENGEVVVFTNIPYAIYLEYGTTKLKPRYHFRNSAARSKKRIQEFLSQNVKKKI